MTRDDIIELALQCGIWIPIARGPERALTIHKLCRLATLVAAAERDTLRAKIETAENDAAHQKALAASALRVAEGWERKCGELRAEVIYWKEQKEPGAAGWRALARILRAKIDAMEQQEPIGGMLEVSPHNYELRWYRPVPFGTKLYTLPGAKGE